MVNKAVKHLNINEGQAKEFVKKIDAGMNSGTFKSEFYKEFIKNNSHFTGTHDNLADYKELGKG